MRNIGQWKGQNGTSGGCGDGANGGKSERQAGSTNRETWPALTAGQEESPEEILNEVPEEVPEIN